MFPLVEIGLRLWPVILTLVAVGVGYVRIVGEVARTTSALTDLARRQEIADERIDEHAIDLVRLTTSTNGMRAQLDRVEAKLDRLIERG